jgi:hypothetical protein
MLEVDWVNGMLQKKLEKVAEERKEVEVTEKEHEAELVRLKMVVAEAEKVLSSTSAYTLDTGFFWQGLAHAKLARLELVVANAEKA